MNNLYFIETDKFELLDIKVNEILKENDLSRDNLITYDMEEVNIADAIIGLPIETSDLDKDWSPPVFW